MEDREEGKIKTMKGLGLDRLKGRRDENKRRMKEKERKFCMPRKVFLMNCHWFIKLRGWGFN